MNRTRLASALAMAGLAAILLPSSLPAQITFEHTYGGAYEDKGWSVQQTRDSGYIIAGWTTDTISFDRAVYLVKTDAKGDVLWTRGLGGADFDEGYAVRQAADDGYVIAGSTLSFGPANPNVYLIKTDTAGDTAWTRVFGGVGYDEGYSVRQTADGGYVVAGTTSSFGPPCGYLVRTDSAGDTLWTRFIQGDSLDCAYSVKQTTDGGYVIAGVTWSHGTGSYDMRLVKTDAGGKDVWSRTCGGTNDEIGHSVQQTLDGGYVATGFTYRDVYNTDVYLVKTDADGDTLWTRIYSRTGYDYAYSVEQTADSGYIVAGTSCGPGTHDADVCLVRTDASGHMLWTKTYGGDTADFGSSVQQTNDGGYVVVGSTYSYGNGYCDVYLIKTDSLGGVAVPVAEPKTSSPRAPGISPTCEPNPCRGATRVSFRPQVSGSKPLTLRVYDSQGRLVHSELGMRSSSIPLDLRSLPPGAYFVLLDADGQHATARVVLQK